MGVLSSVRAVRWARKRQPDQVSYWIALAHPEEHVKRVKPVEELSATKMVLMNVSGGDPHAAIRVDRESVLPELR